MDLLRVLVEQGDDPGRVVLSGAGGATEPGGVNGGGTPGATLRTWTLAELDAAVSGDADRLRQRGVGGGRVRCLVAGPDVATVRELLATWRAGAVPALLNARLTGREREEAAAALEGREAPGAQVVLWTSGTSGRPRPLTLSWAAVEGHARAVAERLALGPADAWLAALSPAHVGGFMLVTRALLTGARLVAPGDAGTDPLARALTGEPAVTHVSLVPTQLLRLLDAGVRPAAALRCVLLGGAHTPAELLRRALDAGCPVALTYGMTEMASQVATAPPALVRARPGTVGTPLRGVEVRVRPDGEVEVRSPYAARRLDGGAFTDADGWYATGDLGRLDADGHLWITGRRAERIISGGVNVDPVEVEEALRAHPAVRDACVVGLPDAEWGEVVAAVVVPVEGEFDLDEVDAWLRERLAGPKRPRRWRVAAELPLNASGKVDRGAVRAAWDVDTNIV